MAQNRESPRKKARVALPTTYSPKTATRAGGGMLTNCYTEIGRDARVVKRPGMSNLGPVAVDCVVGQGTTFFNNDVAYVTCDILKIGSCSAGLPLNESFQVGGLGDAFAVYSPRTGLVWTVDSTTSTVRIRDYTTKTLVASIPPPPHGDHGSSGMCYLPDMRSFCVVQSGPLLSIHNYDLPEGGPLFWFIDEDTHAITQVVKCQADIAFANTWVGSPVYLQQLQTILLLWNNGAFARGFQSTHAMSGWAQASATTFPVETAWVEGGTLTMYSEQKYATTHLGLFTDADKLFIVGYAGVPYRSSYTISKGSQLLCPMAYDSKRRRLWVAQASPDKLSYIDVSTDPPGVLTDVAALPKAMFNMAYDVNKDVLWAVSTYDGSNTIYKLNPVDGSVILSQAAAFATTNQYWQFTQALACSVIGFSNNDRAWIDNAN